MTKQRLSEALEEMMQDDDELRRAGAEVTRVGPLELEVRIPRPDGGGLARRFVVRVSEPI